MPYYQGPRIQKPSPEVETADTHYIQGLLSELIVLDGGGHTTLSNLLIKFEQLQSLWLNCLLIFAPKFDLHQ
jgi:hypothetical protein